MHLALLGFFLALAGNFLMVSNGWAGTSSYDTNSWDSWGSGPGFGDFWVPDGTTKINIAVTGAQGGNDHRLPIERKAEA